MIRILYVHGYEGHGDGHSSRLVMEALDSLGVDYELDAPEFPVTEPAEMEARLSKLINDGHYNVIVASSLGAFYTMRHSETFTILVNPALPENLRDIRDADPEKHPKLTDEFLERLERAKDFFFDHTFAMFDDEHVFGTYFVFGDHDNIAGNETFFREYYHREDHFFNVDMGHILEPAGAAKVAEIIQIIDTERPEYVDTLSAVLAETFKDFYDEI